MMESDFRPRLKGNTKAAYDNFTKKERRILVIGDIHAPFTLEGYLEFCQDVYARYNLNQVIFIGGLLDNHYSSYHETDPSGSSGKDELECAIEQVALWKEAFPVADVIIGNHDRLIMRKAFSSDVPKEWIKSYNEVLGTNWNWTERIVYDNVQFVHGEGGTARTKARNDMMSTVSGHIHTQAYTEWLVGGVDASSYAAAYAKNFKRQAIGCGVVLGGHTAINCLMEL